MGLPCAGACGLRSAGVNAKGAERSLCNDTVERSIPRRPTPGWPAGHVKRRCGRVRCDSGRRPTGSRVHAWYVLSSVSFEWPGWTAGRAELVTPGKRFPSGTPGRKSRCKKGVGLAKSPRFSASTGVEVSSSQGCEKLSGAVVRTAPDFAWRQRTAGTGPAHPPHTDIRAGRSAAGHRATAGSWRTRGG